jgi:hypothetical protein
VLVLVRGERRLLNVVHHARRLDRMPVLPVLVLGHRRHAVTAARVRAIAALSRKCASCSVVVLPATDEDVTLRPASRFARGGRAFL